MADTPQSWAEKRERLRLEAQAAATRVSSIGIDPRTYGVLSSNEDYHNIRITGDGAYEYR